MAMTSRYVSAYFNLFLRMRIKGKHSLDLWGPDDGLGACKKRIIENIIQPGEEVMKRNRK